MDTKTSEHRTQSSRTVNYNKVYEVPVPQPVGVPTPVVYNVPYVKYEYVPVKEPCDTCCCGNKAALGDVKIVNHTNINWVKGGKVRRSKSHRDSQDSSEESRKGPKNWQEVLQRFNRINGEQNALTGTGELSQDHLDQQALARRNLDRLTRYTAGKRAASSRRTVAPVQVENRQPAGFLDADRNSTVAHWNTRKDQSSVYALRHWVRDPYSNNAVQQ